MLRTLALVTAFLVTASSQNIIFANDDAEHMLALNLYHEARGEGRDGMIAVGWVVLNRIEDPKYPSDVVAVVTQTRGSRCEWGWWCDGKSDKPTEAGKWAEAQALASELLSANKPSDPTDGALWFMESFRDRPSWMGDDVAQTVTIGAHNFFGRR